MKTKTNLQYDPDKYKIEHGVRITERYHGKWKTFFGKLRVGDSVFVDTERERQNIYRSADWHKVRVLTRKVNGKGFRIWRVK